MVAAAARSTQPLAEERGVVLEVGDAAPDLADSPSTGELMVVSAVGGLADFARALRLGLESEKER